jgi:excinuclease ABC subunit A
VRAFAGSTYSESQDDLERAARKRGVDLDTPFCDLPADQQALDHRRRGSRPRAAWKRGLWYGVRGFFKWLEARAYKMHVRIFLSRFRAYTTCSDCDGGRLKKEAYTSASPVAPSPTSGTCRSPICCLRAEPDPPAADHAAPMLRDEICAASATSTAPASATSISTARPARSAAANSSA